MADPSPQYSMAMAGLYPDTSQWTNPYSSYSGKIPFPPGYVGTPTDAYGKPIQSYQAPQQPQGTTLNTSPSMNQPWAAGIAPGNPAIAAGNTAAGLQALSSMLPIQGQPGHYLAGPGTPGVTAQNPAGYWAQPGGQQGGGQAGGVQPASNSGSYQAALNALSNPNPVVTQGATPSQTPAFTQGVLNNFLQNWKPGAGNAPPAMPGIGGGSSGLTFGSNPIMNFLGRT